MAKRGALFSFSFTSARKSLKNDEEEQVPESSEAVGHRFPSDRCEAASCSSDVEEELEEDTRTWSWKWNCRKTLRRTISSDLVYFISGGYSQRMTKKKKKIIDLHTDSSKLRSGACGE